MGVGGPTCYHTARIWTFKMRLSMKSDQSSAHRAASFQVGQILFQYKRWPSCLGRGGSGAGRGWVKRAVGRRGQGRVERGGGGGVDRAVKW